MDHFERRRGAQHPFIFDTEKPGRLDQQKWPQPLAAAERSVTQGLDETGRTIGLARHWLERQEPVKHMLRRLGDRREPCLKFLSCRGSRHFLLHIAHEVSVPLA